MRQLRAAAALLEQSGNHDAEAIAAAIRRYDQDAPHGCTLEEALGLSARGGAGPWWIQEARIMRDGIFRALHREHFSNLGLIAAAKRIVTLASARKRATTPPRNQQEEMVDAALRPGLGVPGPRRLATLLGNPITD